MGKWVSQVLLQRLYELRPLFKENWVDLPKRYGRVLVYALDLVFRAMGQYQEEVQRVYPEGRGHNFYENRLYKPL